MKVLFIHQNFPGQFCHLAPALVKAGHQVAALSMSVREDVRWEGVKVYAYSVARGSTQDIHPWLVDIETKIIRAEACLAAARRLQEKGFTPDIIVAHHGWGESMFLKEVWPSTPLGLYCEFFYKTSGGDTSFDNEFSPKDPIFDNCRLRLKNVNNLIHFEVGDLGISPTSWQASTFPTRFQEKISVIHDGIDTRHLLPNQEACIRFKTKSGSVSLTAEEEIITFVNRTLEPYRGFHIFMRALPNILQRRPNVKVLIVGGTEGGYGAGPESYGHEKGRTWKEIFIEEVRDKISSADWSRVFFLGNLNRNDFTTVLQLSSCHVYLTYPFVLSWSLLEAMSIGCPIVASRTEPVLDAISDDETGRLIDFFDPQALAEACDEIISDTKLASRMSHAARTEAISKYDLHTHCLPEQLNWVDKLSTV